MVRIRTPRWWLGTVLAVCWTGLVSPAGLASGLSAEELAKLGEEAAREKAAGNWAKAVWYYGGLHHCDRKNPLFKRELQICLRHLLRSQRLADPAYSEEVLRLDPKVALDVYVEILTTLRDRYLIPELTSPEALYQNGLEELKLALTDSEFRRRHVARNKNTQKTVNLFLAAVEKVEAPTFPNPIETMRRRVQEVAMTAEWALGVHPTVTIFEFACGACNALDEHTYYLSPKHFAGDVGDTGDIGVEVAMNKLKQPVVTAVYENSPAAKAGIKVGDVINRVDRERDLSRWSREAVADRLKGGLGTKVELEITSPGDEQPRVVSVERHPIIVRGVTTQMLDLQAGVGYLHVFNFQQNTEAEIRNALEDLHGLGANAIVMDLRGNPGGSFEEAVRTAELFLPYNSPIVSLKGRDGEKRGQPLRSSNRDPLRTPLFVLVDRETASAAELLAGALKENDRALLIGQRTFGKGTMQEIERLLKDRKVLDERKRFQAGGIRFTRAHFLSPLNNLYHEQGVLPHKIVENPPSKNFDEQLETALREARDAAQNFSMMTMMR